ncbi:MAG: hypothetical protein AAGA56_02670 [Myxococcota bacterium]
MLALGVAACDSDPERVPATVDGDEGGATGDGGSDGEPGGDGGEGGGGKDHPCVNAPLLDTHGSGPNRYMHQATLTAAGAFYGTFPAEAGTWIATSVWDLTANTDVVVRLFSEDGKELLASTDGAPPEFGQIDGVMYHYVATSRTYCVEVLDYDVWADEQSKADGNQGFRLLVSSVADFWGSGGTVIEEGGGNNTLDTAQPVGIELAQSVGVILGRLNSAADRDVYRFEGANPNWAYRLVSLSLPGPGNASSFGWGGNTEGRVTVLGADGATILASNSFSDMAATCSTYNLERCTMLIPEIVGETYYVVVESEGDPGDDGNADEGSAPYSVSIDLVEFFATAEGLDEGANDISSQAVVMQPNPIGEGTEILIQGTLGDEDDVDWWRLDELPGGDVHLWCGSSFLGSGVEGLSVTAFAAADPEQPSRTQTEAADAPIRWGHGRAKGEASAPPLSPGSYLFRVDASSLRANHASTLYHCYLAQLEENAADRR